MSSLSVGAPAPEFTLPTSGGGSISLRGLRGMKTVLYFYPKADTPGCTLESVEFSCKSEAFAKADTIVLGISADPMKSQDRFKKKHQLTVTLASDPDHAMLNAYGVWTEKSMFGRKYMGIARTTVLIDPDGLIARIWQGVKVGAMPARCWPRRKPWVEIFPEACAFATY